MSQLNQAGQHTYSLRASLQLRGELVGEIEAGGFLQGNCPRDAEELGHKLRAEIALFPPEGEMEETEPHAQNRIAVLLPVLSNGLDAGLNTPIGRVGDEDPIAAAGGNAPPAEFFRRLFCKAAEVELSLIHI